MCACACHPLITLGLSDKSLELNYISHLHLLSVVDDELVVLQLPVLRSRLVEASAEASATEAASAKGSEASETSTESGLVACHVEVLCASSKAAREETT